MNEARLVPAYSFCWNKKCPDFGKVDQGNVVKFGHTAKGYPGMPFSARRTGQPCIHPPNQRDQGGDGYSLAAGGGRSCRGDRGTDAGQLQNDSSSNGCHVVLRRP